MADPKYAKLPGIDLHSPDVYETSDLPESEQGFSFAAQEESPDEAIESIQLDTKSAYEQFRGKGVEGKDIDFSDKISAGRRTGYNARIEYEMLGEGTGNVETPQQKFLRLQHEMRELTEEVNKIKDNVKTASSEEKLSPVALGKQLEYLQHQLGDLHLEKILGPDASVDLSDPQGAFQKRLITQLDAFKSVHGDKPSATKKDDIIGDHVTYELFYRPEQAQFSRNAKLASLEERLERLEAAIGNHPEKLGILTADTDNKSLVGAVAIVNSKLSLLDPTNIEQVDVRLHSVLLKLDKIAEKKNTQPDGDKQNKISELYSLVKKWETTADILPQVVDRLSALKDLHEQALQFSHALAYLDTTQQEINSSLASYGDILQQLEKTMKDNAESIKKNCESMDSRIKTLQ